MKINPADVQLIPVNRIRIVNPRDREKEKYDQIVTNIKTIGLKRPITVTLQPGVRPGEESYDLVCGQGRLEAFLALGQSQIPAFIRNFDRHQGLLASLIENIARRRVRAIDQIQAIRWMHDQHQPAEQIGRKTGLAERYVKQILALLTRGEERLLEAALHGKIPITIATKIAESKDTDVQRLLMEAYERKEISSRALSSLRRVIQLRKSHGAESTGGRRAGKRKSSVESFVASYRAQTDKQRLLIRKARACEGRRLAIAAAFRALMADEDFCTLLRAEKLERLPTVLNERMKGTV